MKVGYRYYLGLVRVRLEPHAPSQLSVLGMSLLHTCLDSAGDHRMSFIYYILDGPLRIPDALFCSI